MLVSEIFFSVQGETTRVGELCAFVRLAGCPIRCIWCDTKSAFKKGKEMDISEIIKAIRLLPARFVCVTGGEPLSHEETPTLLKYLIDEDYECQLMTSGFFSLENIPHSVSIILDIKTPWCHNANPPDSLGAEIPPPPYLHDRNLSIIDGNDEVKFVVRTKGEFDWCVRFSEDRALFDRVRAVFVTPCWGILKPSKLVEWMKQRGLPFRLNLQVHKYIGVR